MVKMAIMSISRIVIVLHFFKLTKVPLCDKLMEMHSIKSDAE